MIKEKLKKGLKNWKEFMGFNMVEIMETNIQKQKPNNSVIAKSQLDIATQMGISIPTLQNYKLLSDMIPEIKNNWTICPVLDFSM